MRIDRDLIALLHQEFIDLPQYVAVVAVSVGILATVAMVRSVLLPEVAKESIGVHRIASQSSLSARLSERWPRRASSSVSSLSTIPFHDAAASRVRT
jgi:hypothetical protein